MAKRQSKQTSRNTKTPTLGDLICPGCLERPPEFLCSPGDLATLWKQHQQNPSLSASFYSEESTVDMEALVSRSVADLLCPLETQPQEQQYTTCTTTISTISYATNDGTFSQDSASSVLTCSFTDEQSQSLDSRSTTRNDSQTADLSTKDQNHTQSKETLVDCPNTTPPPTYSHHSNNKSCSSFDDAAKWTPVKKNKKSPLKKKLEEKFKSSPLQESSSIEEDDSNDDINSSHRFSPLRLQLEHKFKSSPLKSSRHHHHNASHDTTDDTAVESLGMDDSTFTAQESSILETVPELVLEPASESILDISDHNFGMHQSTMEEGIERELSRIILYDNEQDEEEESVWIQKDTSSWSLDGSFLQEAMEQLAIEISAEDAVITKQKEEDLEKNDSVKDSERNNNGKYENSAVSSTRDTDAAADEQDVVIENNNALDDSERYDNGEGKDIVDAKEAVDELAEDIAAEDVVADEQDVVEKNDTANVLERNDDCKDKDIVDVKAAANELDDEITAEDDATDKQDFVVEKNDTIEDSERNDDGKYEDVTVCTKDEGVATENLKVIENESEKESERGDDESGKNVVVDAEETVSELANEITDVIAVTEDDPKIENVEIAEIIDDSSEKDVIDMKQQPVLEICEDNVNVEAGLEGQPVSYSEGIGDKLAKDVDNIKEQHVVENIQHKVMNNEMVVFANQGFDSVRHNDKDLHQVDETHENPQDTQKSDYQVGPVLRNMGKYPGRKVLQQHGMKVLLEASKDPNSSSAIARGIPTLLATMKRYRFERMIQWRGLVTLKNLCNVELYAEALVFKYKGIPVIVDNMAEYSMDAEMVIAVCGLFDKLCLFGQVRKPCVDAKAVKLLADILEKNPGDYKQQQALRQSIKSLL